MGRMARRVVVAGLLAGLLAALLSGLGACTSDDSQPPEPEQSAGDVALQVVSVKTPGVDEQALTELESEVGDVIASYIVEGFLGDYPREDFVRSLADFTNGLVDDGGLDLAVLTLSGTPEIADVRATKLHARLAYFNPGDEVVGATAFLDLAFDVTLADGSTRAVTRSGKLVLGRVDSDWRIFGYAMCCFDGESVRAETAS